MKVTKTKVFNFEGAVRGMRNPMESWDRSDSEERQGTFYLGSNDKDLALRLIRAGNEHRKFMRQIMVSFDLEAPLYYWKEFDTYKVATVANSTSTMHKLATTEITLECFELDCLHETGLPDPTIKNIWASLIEDLEQIRLTYLETKNKYYWKELVRLLPSAWLQTRTITMNYEILFNIYHQRKNHKLSEWRQFCDWIKNLPYMQDFLLLNDKVDKN